MTITIDGEQYETPPNCLYFKADHPIEKGKVYFDSDFTMVLWFADGSCNERWEYTNGLLHIICICESYWRREAERINDTGKYELAEDAAWDNAERFAALHRKKMKEAPCRAT